MSGEQGLILFAHVFAHLGPLLSVKRVVIQSVTPFLLSLFTMRAKFAKTIELFVTVIEVHLPLSVIFHLAYYFVRCTN